MKRRRKMMRGRMMMRRRKMMRSRMMMVGG